MGLQKSSSNPKHETSSKPPFPSPSSGNKTTNTSQKAGFSRSFGVYFPRSSAQVQPRPPDVTELLRLVEELRERESGLKTELLEHKLLKESVAIVPVLENEIVVKNAELERALEEVERLRKGNEVLKTEVEEMKGKIEEEKVEREKKVMEMEEEIAELKKTVSSCSDRNSKAEITAESDELISTSQQFQGLVEVGAKSNLIKNLKRYNHNGKCTNAIVFSVLNNEKAQSMEFNTEEFESERRGHSASNSEELVESTSVNIRSRVPRVPKPPPRPSSSSSTSSSNDSTEKQTSPPPPPPPPAQVAAVKLVAPPPPPPLPIKAIAPPPPPPPRKGTRTIATNVRRVPEVVEFYHSLMRRDSKREAGGCTVPDALPATAISRDMIGEIENRSAYLLAIRTDVETQGDFIRFLIKEVENAAFTDIEDVVPFVKWLDDELSYLVDERAVLKHFDWPEKKSDALREAAFGYCDIKKLESDASLFRDDPRQPCAPALKKMQALLEKLEHGVYNLSRMRESAANRFKGFHIPTDWMLETGIVCQMKLASVKLAMKYMRRVSAELEAVGGVPEEKDLIVQGVRFAFRVHQFAGGFDVETMKAFQELRDKARTCHVQYQSQ
ncbi:phospholipase A1-IIgamma-like [Hibiscus syriacus]|uniref:Phospholipase A1-IIgamma-like n=2 Tax=Hibiscus syriacus TaxID=106335 RepID=A0A6A2ZBY2_HIBSY|nr:phospholipase A1-IIgamma-like [Hibiscus syriacus]